MKQLTDFEDYVQISETVARLRSEEQQMRDRIDQINIELSKPRKQIYGKDAWGAALEGESRWDVELATELREELQMSEGRLAFIQEALETGQHELDRVHGRYSREICQSYLSEIEADARLALTAVKQLSDINEREQARIAKIEAEGVRTDSLPRIGYDVGGRWNDQYGGRVVGYQRFIAETFPSLASLAGQAVKSRLRALAAREQAFNEEGATTE